MKGLLDNTLEHLAALVACDTQNPPLAIRESGAFTYLAAQLPGFRTTQTEHGNGGVSLLAVRGSPDTLFNFHLDTVPAGDGWRRDPFALGVGEGRATGLGACDIKGAAAAMLAACHATTGDVALLFTSDEEAGRGECVPAFLRSGHAFERVVVAEPTLCEAVLAHRGIASATIEFAGEAGHASDRERLGQSAVHRAVRWAARCLDYAHDREEDAFDGLSGLPLNIGRIEGGIKPNMVASSASIRLGIRPLPMQDGADILATLEDFADPAVVQRFSIDFIGPALPPAGTDPAAAAAFAGELGLRPGPAVNFWTEAALFAATSMTAIVYGPGNIAQAHTADEWVAIEQLEQAALAYRRIVGQGESADA